MVWTFVVAAFAVGQVAPAPQVPPTIGWAEIEAARALLGQARQSLQPQQYQVLEKGLVEVEGAFQRYATLVKASGRAAEVARGPQALTGAERASRIAQGLGAISRAGPVLVALALLYPSSTATQEQDYPGWMRARDELEMKLRQVAVDSLRVGEEIETAQRAGGQKGSVKAPGATSGKGSSQPPGDPPCLHIGTSGRGANLHPKAPPDKMTCTYQCGEKRIKLPVWGTTDADCERPENFERARREAARRREQGERR